ncbi:glycosyltransferase family 2 protein [Clostridium cochlearium]|uniref:Glycosyltransferase family 2 protein n=1 Tax=Clostridium cochlearium TaxID=1494 RepID=A0A239ZZ25_CLOCO|nr:glycosyltransferase family 2 protein [Clostridium cochlearium]MBV1819399.1 glycosyltransferase [Bacteroidales bacterium MSK.15.36]NSJ90622.1 glycosyltransferase family 2 protein [Coprococcus sp. MSK.21.13]MBE6064372.1 glycosyltransferase [Clostridium cochlearium]MBU5268818.1 glycosyltransferase [Clostridium cochlearium]MCG4570890.1 glycosyltransferase [Clostridium cochlearium]
MNNFVFLATSVFQIVVFLMTMYYFILSLFGLHKKDEVDGNLVKPEKTFALIVAAHNEETVIGHIIDSLKKLDYPDNLYDIFVIADNCTDDTAKISKKLDVNVFERNVPSKRGKGYALEWMFDKIFKMEKKYDAIAVFDADNLVSANFLKEMNAKLLDGYKVVQGYIDSKNPEDSWITQSYSISFWTANRLFQLARWNLGLSNQIGGTGFCMETDILKQLGWGATCLTEDLEFTCKLVLNGHKVGWSHNAIVYDEKPLTLKQSWSQRKRWMQGFADVSSRFFAKLMKKAIKDRDFRAFDCALYSIQPFFTLLLAISAILTMMQNSSANGLNIFVINSLFAPWIWKVFSIFQFLFTPFIMLLEEKLHKKMFFVFSIYSLNIFFNEIIFGNNPKLFEVVLGSILYFSLFVLILFIFNKKHYITLFIWYLLYGFYTLTWIPITVQGILNKNNKEWSHTKHTRKITIQDVE